MIIAVSSTAPQDALEAAHFAIDRLKATVPVSGRRILRRRRGEEERASGRRTRSGTRTGSDSRRGTN